MSSYYGSKVVIHQAAPSIPSSASRSSSSHRSGSYYTMDSSRESSYSPPRGSDRREHREHREYDAAKYSSTTTSRRKAVVHNLNQGVDDKQAPTPGYSNARVHSTKSGH